MVTVLVSPQIESCVWPKEGEMGRLDRRDTLVYFVRWVSCTCGDQVVWEPLSCGNNVKTYLFRSQRGKHILSQQTASMKGQERSIPTKQTWDLIAAKWHQTLPLQTLRTSECSGWLMFVALHNLIPIVLRYILHVSPRCFEGQFAFH